MENFISPLRFKKSNYVIRLFSNNKYQEQLYSCSDDYTNILVPLPAHYFWLFVPRSWEKAKYGWARDKAKWTQMLTQITQISISNDN